MSRETVLTVGAYRGGLSPNTVSVLEETEEKEKAGFRMLPAEEAILELGRIAEGYDEFVDVVEVEPIIYQYEEPIGPEELSRRTKRKSG